MPYITAKENAGLSPQQDPSYADSFVRENGQIGIDWIEYIDIDIAKIKLAGPYTSPDGTNRLPVGAERYLNPKRFIIPEDAWLKVSSERTTLTSFQPSPPLSPLTGENILPPETTRLTHYYEGFENYAYRDKVNSDGLPITIGWGNTYYENGRRVQLGDYITKDRGNELYENILISDFLSVLQKIIPHWFEMTNKQRAALLSFSYNTGAYFYGAEGYDTITTKLKDKLWDQVPYALMLYRAGAQVGLGRRRYAEGLTWCGMEPEKACKEADVAIQNPDDAERIEQQLQDSPPQVLGWNSTSGQTTSDHAPPIESVREPYDTSKPIDWYNPNCKVSKYFTVKEVTNNDPRRIPKPGSIEEKNIKALAKELDQVRELWGGPIGVTSWFRPEPVNSEVNGAENSQHIYGRAVDIYTMDSDGYSQRDREFESWLDTVAWKDMALGYGIKSGRGFTHCDLRRTSPPIRWIY